MKQILVFSLAISGFALAESAIPASFTRERYDGTFAASPFALATPTPPPPILRDDPLKDLVVTGLGKLDDGREFVVVQRTGEGKSMRFDSNEPNRDGIAVKRVLWADTWSNSKVVLSHDGQEKVISFDPNPVPPRVPPPGPGRKNSPRPPGKPLLTL
jgi:hypothetical protein